MMVFVLKELHLAFSIPFLVMVNEIPFLVGLPVFGLVCGHVDPREEVREKDNA